MNPVDVAPFGRLPDGRETRLFTLGAASGVRAAISDFGGAVVRLTVPDRRGRPGDVVLGLGSAALYAGCTAYLGCLIGRFGNRIAGGRFALDGRAYPLAANNAPAGAPCHLHGGPGGFHQVLWSAEAATVAGQPALRLGHLSPDGDEGYPGNLSVTVTFIVTEDALRLDYEAATDRPTPVNLTHHGYFNLRGEGAGDIGGHELTLRASHFTPVTAGLIPTGEIAPVAGTPFDFRAPRRIGERIDQPDEQLRRANGYDHNFVLDGRTEHGPAPAAVVDEPESGRRMEVLTTEPGVQFYSGNFLDGTLTGKSGRPYGRRSGFCLETQHFPDAPNQPAFPNTILRPGQRFRSSTVYRFAVA